MAYPGPPPPDRRCIATVKSGEQCPHWAMQGQRVCKKHGGKAPQNLKAAAVRIAEAKAAKLAARADIAVIDNPITALAQNASRIQHMTEQVWDYVAAIDMADWESFSAEQATQLQAHVTLLRNLLGDLDRSLHNWVKLGLDERMVRLSEAEADRVTLAFANALAASGLTAEVQDHLRSLLVAELVKIGRAEIER